MKHVYCRVLPIYLITVGLLLLLLLTYNLTAEDKETPSSSAPSQLSKDLIGTWALVGTPDKLGEVPPNAERRLKFLTGRHWVITQADPNGIVLYHHGGTYTLDGDKYVEAVEYANKNTTSLIKNSFKFKVKVEGDTLTQVGIENPWAEVWKRVK